MALPTALFAMIASFALASAAVLSSVDAQQGTQRDHYSKEAIAAADSGANLALLRLNRFMPSLSTETPCVGPSGEAQTASGGWCPATVPQTVGNGSFSYMVSASNGTGSVKVVSVGTSGTVSRRVYVGLKAINEKTVFFDSQLIGLNGITMSNAKIDTNVGTNGAFLEANKGEAGKICGNIEVGPGHAGESPTPTCPGKTVTEGTQSLPPVNPPANIATVNSNCRLSGISVSTCENGEVDTYSAKRTSTIPWDPVHRVVKIGRGASLTVGGKDYFLCQLFIEAGELRMAFPAHPRFYFDTPEHCNLPAGSAQIEMSGNAHITATGFNPEQETYDVPGFYVMGSPTIPTVVKLTGTAGSSELMLYAPNSDVTISGTVEWIGMFAGKSMTIKGGPTIKANPKIKQPNITVASLFGRERYVECTGATASPPDASC
jgi:hypothetical protein